MAPAKKRSLKTPDVKAFISYSTTDREYGGQAKDALAEVGIVAFLAHDDLTVSEEWKTRIIEELKRCTIFVPLLSKNFVKSKWAQQEVGFIVSRPEVAIAPISLDGTTPFGFISHVQSRKVSTEGITRRLLVEPLAKRIPRQLLPGLIRLVSRASSFRSAESLMAPLVDLFPVMNADEAQALAEASVRNAQVWDARLCKQEYLPALLLIHSKSIDRKTVQALKYQIKHSEWYPHS